MTPLRASALFALFLLPTLAQEQLSFQAQSGLVLHKRILLESQTKLDAMRVTAAGVDQETELEMSLSVRQELQLTDTYGALHGAQPGELKRSFERIGHTLSATISTPVLGPQNLRARGLSPLEGQSVRHARSSLDSPWRCSLEPASALPEALARGLRYDLDFVGLLPPGPVREGDTWKVPPTLLNTILAPAGDLRLVLKLDDASGLPLPAGSQAPPLAPLEGRFDATLLGLELSQGSRLARIALSIEVGCNQDLSEMMGDLLKSSTGPGGIEMRSEVRAYGVTWSFEGRGEALWDLERGHLSSLSLQGKHRQTVESAMNVLAAGTEQLITNHMQLSGTQSASLRFAP